MPASCPTGMLARSPAVLPNPMVFARSSARLPFVTQPKCCWFLFLMAFVGGLLPSYLLCGVGLFFCHRLDGSGLACCLLACGVFLAGLPWLLLVWGLHVSYVSDRCVGGWVWVCVLLTTSGRVLGPAGSWNRGMVCVCVCVCVGCAGQTGGPLCHWLAKPGACNRDLEPHRTHGPGLPTR